MKLLYWILFFNCSVVVFQTKVNSQPLISLDLESGGSLSVTQLGISPISTARRWYDRGIVSPYFSFNLVYTLSKMDLTLGGRFLQKGFRTSLDVKHNYLLYHEEYQYRMTYIDMPVTVRYKLNKFEVFGGVVLSYLIDDTELYSNRDIVSSSPPTYNEIFFARQTGHVDRFKSWDYGFSVGIGREISPQLSLVLNLQRGMVNIDTWNSVDIRYHASAMLGLKYRLAILSKQKNN